MGWRWAQPEPLGQGRAAAQLLAACAGFRSDLRSPGLLPLSTFGPPPPAPLSEEGDPIRRALHGQTPGQAAGQERCSGATGGDQAAGLAAVGVRSWRLWGTERTSTDKPCARPPTWHPKSHATHRGPSLRPGVTPRAGISIPRVSSTLGDCRREL